MRNKMLNKVLAGMLAGSMVLGMNAVAFADDETEPTPAETEASSGSGTGAGELEGHLDKSKLSVTLPTSDNTGTLFKYTIDPEGLIAATQAAKYPGTTYNSTTGVYFQTSEKNYTDKSAKLKVTNRGSVDADVTVKVSVANNSDITSMKDKGDFNDDGGKELYLGLLINNETIPVAGFNNGEEATKTVGIKGRPANFEVKYNKTDGKYEYAEKDGMADTAWNSFEFGLEGACNEKGDYSADNFTVPTVTVTWSYIQHPETGGAEVLAENATDVAAPSIANKNVAFSKASGAEIIVNLGSGDLAAQGISSVSSLGGDGKTVNVFKAADYSFAGTKLMLNSAATYLKGVSTGEKRTVKVTFNDTAKTVVDLEVTVGE